MPQSSSSRTSVFLRVTATHCRSLMRQWVAYLESNTQRLACRIVLDASHWVAYEQPDTVNRLMIEFFTARGAGNAEGLFL